MNGDRISRKNPASMQVTSRAVSPWYRSDPMLGLVLLVAVVVTYLPLWHAGYFWDDIAYITANPDLRGLLGLKNIWTTSAADISPLTFTTFWLEHALWGYTSPLPYHLVNLFLHGGCAILLWRVLRKLQVPGAWLGAALWALHPVEVESVAWITETKNTESGLFFLCSILFFLRWLTTEEIDGRTGNSWNYGLMLLFAILAMASKSSTVILPVVLCLCAWWLESRWRWLNIARVAPVVFISALASIFTIWTQYLHLAVAAADPQWTRTWPQRLATAGDAVWFYLSKLFWPDTLIVGYPRWEIDAGKWVSYLPTVAVIIVLFILWIKRNSWARPLFFVFAYFLVALLPVLGLVDNFIFRFSLVFDHFQYLASMGPLALAGAGITRLMEAAVPSKPWVQAIPGVGILLVLAMLSWQRATVFESDKTVWTDTLAKNDRSVVAYDHLGSAFLYEGQMDKALTLFQMALKINPNDATAETDLGNVYLQKHEAEKAMDQYQRAVKLDPNNAVVHANIALVLSQKGQLDEAEVEYRKALQIAPTYADAIFGLGNVLQQKGKIEEAVTQFQAGLNMDPVNFAARSNLGAIYLQKGQIDLAIDQFQEALKIEQSSAAAHTNLGLAFGRQGRLDAASTEFQEALELDPTIPQAHNGLGLILSQKGRWDAAIGEFKRALEIDPSFAEAHTSLGIAFANKRQWEAAIAEFKETVKLTPNDENARKNLAMAQAMATQNAGRK